MVPPDSHGISRVPCYLGKHSRVTVLRLQGYNPLRLNIPEDSTSTVIDNSSTPRHQCQNAPTTPHAQRTPAITRTWFSLIRFRSPLLTESQLFSLPAGTEMFHFPTFPPHTLFHSGAGNRTQLRLGSPIRTPPDHSSVANSPGLIAGSNVLHRLLVPRHPPIALSSLSQQKIAKSQNATKRCSRPLYSSQNTGRNTNPEPPPIEQTPQTPGKQHTQIKTPTPTVW